MTKFRYVWTRFLANGFWPPKMAIIEGGVQIAQLYKYVFKKTFKTFKSLKFCNWNCQNYFVRGTLRWTRKWYLPLFWFTDRSLGLSLSRLNWNGFFWNVNFNFSKQNNWAALLWCYWRVSRISWHKNQRSGCNLDKYVAGDRLGFSTWRQHFSVKITAKLEGPNKMV